MSARATPSSWSRARRASSPPSRTAVPGRSPAPCSSSERTAWAAVRAVGAGAGDASSCPRRRRRGRARHRAARPAGRRAVIGLASETNHAWLREHGVIPVTYGDGMPERIREAAPPRRRPRSSTSPAAHTSSSPSSSASRRNGSTRSSTLRPCESTASRPRAAPPRGRGAGRTGRPDRRRRARGPDRRARYPLDQVRDAYTELERGHTRGQDRAGALTGGRRSAAAPGPASRSGTRASAGCGRTAGRPRGWRSAPWWRSRPRRSRRAGP